MPIVPRPPPGRSAVGLVSDRGREPNASVSRGVRRFVARRDEGQGRRRQERTDPRQRQEYAIVHSGRVGACKTHEQPCR
jgi:hypothetical protein